MKNVNQHSKQSLQWSCHVGLALLGAASVIVGCRLSGAGLAGNGRFDYACSDPKADPYCQTGYASDGDMPRSVALGARFRMKFRTSDGTAFDVKAASPEAVGKKSGDFVTLRAGRVGFVVEDGDVAVDAIRVDVVEPHHLTISSDTLGIGFRQARRTETVRAHATFTAHAENDQNEALPGTMPTEWTIDDPSVATVTRVGDGTCTVEAVKSGTTVLRATSGSFKAEVRISTNDLLTWDDGGTRDADAGTGDADADAGTGEANSLDAGGDQ